MDALNISTIAKKFSDEAVAYKFLEDMRWPNGPECPHCGSIDHAYFLKPRNGSRPTSTGKASYRRLWKCAECRKQFSVLLGTIFERSHIPLSNWLLALYMMASNKNGVAAFEIHRTLGVTNKTAWFMMHRIREAMKASPVDGSMMGTIIADETFIGGDPQNRHGGGRVRNLEPVRIDPTVKKRPYTEKTPVFSLIEKETGEVRSRVLADVTATLRKAISEQVNMAGSRLHTDGGMAYRRLAPEFIAHEWVDHSSGEYVRGKVTTNHVEGFFSQLKRSIDGTHHRVSVEHLPRYLAEFDFRYSTRKINGTPRVPVGRSRLPAPASGSRAAGGRRSGPLTPTLL